MQTAEQILKVFPKIPIENVFEILTGQLKHHKPFSQKKIDSCYAKLYDLSHSYKILELTMQILKFLKVVILPKNVKIK